MQKILNVSARAKQRVATLFVLTALGALMAMPAFAETGTGVEDVIEDGFSELTGLVTGTLAVALFLIVTTVLAIIMGVKWLGKGTKQS